MYIAPQLEGVRGKLYRAIDHFRDLDVAVGELFAFKSEKAGSNLDDEGNMIVTFPYQPPLDPRFAAIIGDCIHNTRSALDHLVAQLAILNRENWPTVVGAPVDATEKTSFPICLDGKEFKEQTRRKVTPYITSDALAEIEKLQPYSTGDMEKDILWVLSKLDVIDKHRLFLVAQQQARVASFTVTVEGSDPSEKRGLWAQLEPSPPSSSTWKKANNILAG